ncbi:MAG: transcription termination/antitermination protein NusA [Anaerolineaceae bacterium]|nr:transcription termination/antitermination protein NusA [Anaerolineaceae bacterium]
MKSEFVLAFNEVLEEKQLPRDVIIQALESAMVSAYRKAVTASAAQHVEAKLDPETGRFVIYAEKEVVDSVVDNRTEVILEEARKVDPDAQLGDMVIVESTPKDFGRVAAQTARQVIQQRIRDAERNDQMSHFEKQIGEIVSGVVQAINREGYTIGLDKKAEGILQQNNIIRGERFHMHDRVRALVVEVKDNPRNPQIVLSRTHKDFLRRLLENEVPEIFHGIVEIRSITREPGERAKIAVSATQQGIDPVGACVGLRGVRIQAIVRELHDEKIDVIEWNPDPVIYISKAISPARVVGVYLGEGNSATVIVPEDQLSLAIGREGQNARLAARLTGWRIDIKSVIEAASELIHTYEQGEDVVLTHETSGEEIRITIAELFADEEENIDKVRAVLAKKAEGRAILPEEIEILNGFVDRVEKRKTAKVHFSVADVLKMIGRKGLTQEEIEALSVQDSGLPAHVCEILENNGYRTFDDIYNVMKNDPDVMFKLRGVTADDMNDLTRIVTFVSKHKAAAEPEPVVESEPEIEEPEAEVEVTEPVAEPEPVAEVVEEPVTEPEPVAEAEPEVEEQELSMEDIFNSVSNGLMKMSDYEDDDDSRMDIGYSKPSKKKKKKKGVEIEYDPDSDSTTVRRKHKRGDDDWGW